MTLGEWLDAAPAWLPQEVKRALWAMADGNPRPTAESRLAVVRTVCASHGIDVEHVLGRTKKAKVMAARLACYSALRGLGCSYTEIARVMHRKDHTAPLYALSNKRRKVARVVVRDAWRVLAGEVAAE